MERIIRVGAIFALVTLTSLLAIVIANGELTWATGGLMLVVLLVIGLTAGTWAIVHNQFSKTTEVGITIGIVAIMIIMFALLLMGGSEIKQACKDLFDDSSAWWLAAPAGGTAAIVVIFGLHKD